MYKITYMGDGSMTEFSFNFPFYENTNIIVKKNGNPITIGFNVVGTSAGENADIPYTGGKVVFDIAPIATDTITISRKIPLTRIVDYQPTEKINPTILNQDQNYTLEVLKDFDGDFEEIDKKYGEIIDTESTQTLITKIDTVTTQIENLGDISTLRDDVSELKTTTASQGETIGTHTNSITTNANNINILDTRTNGMIDYVVESQSPTAANNYTWYRKYKSGWVEQGGHSVGSLSGEKLIHLPITMANKRYQFIATMSLSDNDSSPQTVLGIRRQRNSVNDTTSSVAVLATYTISGTNGYTGWDFDWEVKGFSA